MNPHYPEVSLRADHRCEYCHAPEAVFNLAFEVEHIIPVSQGGSDNDNNWALACRSCNLRKGAHKSGIDPEGKSKVNLFHPRENSWEEHFHINIEKGEIVGLTPMGRATIDRLEFNSLKQIAARKQWIQLGLFP